MLLDSLPLTKLDNAFLVTSTPLGLVPVHFAYLIYQKLSSGHSDGTRGAI